jgi:PQQ-dependent dehydrogenase (methanol/ethanol family)
LAGCGEHKSSEPPSAANVDGERIEAAASDAANWVTHGRTYAEDRFSPLKGINDNNVGQLGLAWFVDFGSRIGIEATPLVVDGVMYTTGVWNVLYALDARTGKELWRFDPQPNRAWLRYMCCGPANRGPAVWKGKVFIGTMDGRLIAVDAATGRPVWDVQTTDRSKPYSITGAPRVVRGKVIIGNGGAEFGVRGYVTAYDAETGKQVWRFYTVPGNPADGFESPAMEMAARTWRGQWWIAGGGGTAWDAFSYDPALNLLYIGTGNGSPWQRDLRSPGGGDNLFLCSIVAVNADDGTYAWHYQAVPGENWDYNCVQQMTLADVDIGGTTRKVLMQAAKNGFFYVIDRTNGKLLSANPFVPVNWASHYDLVTGRPVEIKKNLYSDTEGKLISPGPFGAHNWHPMSYSPLTRFVYFPAQESSFVYSRTPRYEHQPMRWNLAQNPQAKMPAGVTEIIPNTSRGYLLAWNPATNSEAWRIEHRGPWNGGVLATAGNLLIQGASDGRFVIYRADNGEKLWEMPIQTGAVAGPISYEVDGEQYLAVAAGWAGSMVIIGGGLTPVHQAPARLLAFKLGGTASLPAPEPLPALAAPASSASAQTIARGQSLYGQWCRICHGGNVVSSGMTPDLRYMSAETHASFNDIVVRGARPGMPPFADVLSDGDADAIHAFLIDRARRDASSSPLPLAREGRGEGSPLPLPPAGEGRGEGSPLPLPPAGEGRGVGAPLPLPPAGEGRGEGIP